MKPPESMPAVMATYGKPAAMSLVLYTTSNASRMERNIYHNIGGEGWWITHNIAESLKGKRPKNTMERRFVASFCRRIVAQVEYAKREEKRKWWLHKWECIKGAAAWCLVIGNLLWALCVLALAIVRVFATIGVYVLMAIPVVEIVIRLFVLYTLWFLHFFAFQETCAKGVMVERLCNVSAATGQVISCPPELYVASGPIFWAYYEIISKTLYSHLNFYSLTHAYRLLLIMRAREEFLPAPLAWFLIPTCVSDVKIQT